MFGFTNFTGMSFIGKIGQFGLEFSVGIIEEVTLNITGSTVANAAEIPEKMNFKLISKDRVITSTSAVVGSKIAQTKLFDVIAGATTNLYI